MTISVLLTDDQALLRATFRLLIESTTDMEVVAEASHGRECLSLARRHRPDVVVMDLRMPVMDGIEATRLIAQDEALAGTHVLVLTTFETDELVVGAIRAGAAGFIGKGVDPAGLLDAIRIVASGDQLLSPAATRALVERVVAEPDRLDPGRVVGLEHLTERERELVVLVATGMSNIEIGHRIHISPATVKTHVNRAMTKLGARDRAQLVVLAYEAGLAVPGRQD